MRSRNLLFITLVTVSCSSHVFACLKDEVTNKSDRSAIIEYAVGILLKMFPRYEHLKENIINRINVCKKEDNDQFINETSALKYYEKKDGSCVLHALVNSIKEHYEQEIEDIKKEHEQEVQTVSKKNVETLISTVIQYDNQINDLKKNLDNKKNELMVTAEGIGIVVLSTVSLLGLFILARLPTRFY